MLASLLKIEALLKCNICGNLLRSTRTLTECNHRYCENCIYDRLGTEGKCPLCHLPAIVKNLRKDPKNDTLVACVKKLKQLIIEKMDKEEEESYDSTSLQMTATFDTSTRNYRKQQQFMDQNSYSLNQLDKLSQDYQCMDDSDDNDDNSNANILNSLIYTTTPDNNNDNHLSQQNNHLSTTPVINDSKKENENNNNLHLKNKQFFTNNKYDRSTTGINHYHHLLKEKQSQSQQLQIQQKPIKENIITDDLLLQLRYNDKNALDYDGYNNKSSNNNHSSSAGQGNEDKHQFNNPQRKHEHHGTTEENVENLLLEMEINEDINDSDDDDKNKISICNGFSTIKNTLQQSTQLNNNLKKENGGNNKNRKQSCTSVDDLLMAMESEEAAIDDEEEDGEDRGGNNTTSHEPILISTGNISKMITTTKYNNNSIDTTDNIHTKYEKKVDKHHSLPSPASKRRKLTFNESIPHDDKLKDNDPMLLSRIEKWECTFCKFMNNMDQEICVICRYKPSNRNGLIGHYNYSSLKQSLQQQSTIPNIIDTSPVFIPATIEITASQAQTSQYLNQTISIMSTALNKNDSISIDSAMTKVIDLNLKLEICSNIRDIDQVTHLITSINSDGLCTRTSKYLIGIITGKWIVDTSWLLTSIQAGYWLPEQDYEVRGDKTLGYTNGPKRGRERDLSQPFFHDRQFFFYGDYPSKDKLLLMQLVTAGGGTIYSRRPSEKKKDAVIIIIPSISVLLKKNKSTVWLNHCKYVKDRDWLIETVARGVPLDI